MRTIFPQSITETTMLGVCSCKRRANSTGISNCNTEYDKTSVIQFEVENKHKI